jgi:hypothetical protein
MAQTPQQKPKTAEEVKREKEILRTQKLMQKFIKERQRDQRTGSSIANKNLNKQSLKDLKKTGVQSRSAATEFGAEKPEGLTSVIIGSAKEKGAEIAGDLPGAGVVKFFRKRNLQKKAYEELQNKRKNFLKIITESEKENPVGYAKLIQSVKNSYKGDDNISEVLIDTLIEMGITTKEELLLLLDQLAGGVPDEAIQNAINEQLQAAGFESKSIGLSSLPIMPPVLSSNDSPEVSPVSGGVASSSSPVPSSASGLSLNVIEKELKLQTKSLSNIEDSLKIDKSKQREEKLEDKQEETQTESLTTIAQSVSVKSGDKAKERENKLEGERAASLASAGLGGSLDLPDLGEGGEGGGGGGGIIGSIFGSVLNYLGISTLAGGLGISGFIKEKVKSVLGFGKGKTPTPSVTPPRTPSTPPPMPGGAPAPPPPAPTTAPKPRGFFGRMFDRAKGAIKTGKDFVGRGFSAAKNVVGSGISAVKNLATGPAMKALKKQAGPILKAIGKKLPIIGPAISGLISLIDINTIKNDPSLSVKEKKEAIGKSLGAALGMALGSLGGAALGTLIPVPIVGTLAGSFAGGYLGDYIGSSLAGWVGGENVYNVLEKIPVLGSIIGLDEEETPSITPANVNSSELSPNTNEQSMMSSGDVSNLSTTPQTGPMVGTGSATPRTSSSRADQAAQDKARFIAREDLKSKMGVSTLPPGVVTDVKPTGDGYTATATFNPATAEAASRASESLSSSNGSAGGEGIAGRRDLSMNTSSQIDRSTRNEAGMSSSGSDGNTNIVAPSSTSTTNNNNTYSNISMSQEEASFMASQMVNRGSRFSAARFG